MRIVKYGTLMDENKRNRLVKETSTNYQGNNFDNPESIANLVNDVFHLNRKSEEFLYMIALSTRNKPIGVFEVSHGTVNCSIVSPREIFIRALLAGAVSICIVHNHPDGSLNPSRYDEQLTRRIKESGDLLGIKLLDHIIVGDYGFYSFREGGLLI